jgi:hypothetical protein
LGKVVVIGEVALEQPVHLLDDLREARLLLVLNGAGPGLGQWRKLRRLAIAKPQRLPALSM